MAARRPQRQCIARPSYEPSAAERGDRAAKTTAESRMRAQLLSSSPPRRDSTQIDKGKRKRRHSKIESDEESDGEGGGSGDDDGSEMDIDGGVESESDVEEIQPPEPLARSNAPRDLDLKLTERRPKMKLGDPPRYYVKIARHRDGYVYNRKKEKDSSKPMLIEEVLRMPDHPPRILPRVDLSRLQYPGSSHRLSERELVQFVMGATVLPNLKKWASMWLNPDSGSQLFRQMMLKGYPLNEDREGRWEVGFQAIIGHGDGVGCFSCRVCGILPRLEGDILCVMSRFARQMINSNRTFCAGLDQLADEPVYFFARLMLTVWEDVEENPDGFFRILLKSELARPNRPEVRAAFESWYLVPDDMYSTSPSVGPLGQYRLQGWHRKRNTADHQSCISYQNFGVQGIGPRHSEAPYIALIFHSHLSAKRHAAPWREERRKTHQIHERLLCQVRIASRCEVAEGVGARRQERPWQ